MAALPPIPSDSYFQQTFDYYYGQGDSYLKTAIWNRYLTYKGYEAVPEETPAVQEDFKAFVLNYTSMGITGEAISLNQEIPTPSDDFYNTYLDGFYGNLAPSLKKDLWNTFLINHQYSSNPPDSPELRAAFASFIQRTLIGGYFFESQTALSPYEIQKRLIMDLVLAALSKYLEATQALVSIQSALLIFYGKWQQEYTQAMALVPTLYKGMPGAINFSNLDTLLASQYTFGYGNISLQDVIRWGYSKALETPGTTITYGDTNSGPGSYSFQVIQTGTKKELQINFDRETTDDTSIVSWHKETKFVIQDPSASPVVNLDFSGVVDKAGEEFIKLFQSCTDFTTMMKRVYTPDLAKWLCARSSANLNAEITYGNLNDVSVDAANRFQYTLLKETSGGTYTLTYEHPSGTKQTVSGLADEAAVATQIRTLAGGVANLPTTGVLALTGRYLGTDSEGKVITTTVDGSEKTTYYGTQLDQADLQARGEMQATLSQYTENLRSLRTQISNLASQQQSALNQGKDAISAQTDSWTSILETLQSIMSAITKKK